MPMSSALYHPYQKLQELRQFTNGLRSTMTDIDYVLISKDDIKNLVHAYNNKVEYSDHFGTSYNDKLVNQEREIIKRFEIIANNPTDKLTHETTDLVIQNRKLIEENQKLTNLIREIPSIVNFSKKFLADYQDRLMNIYNSTTPKKDQS